MSNNEEKNKSYLFDDKLQTYEQKVKDFLLDIAAHKRANPKLALISANLLLHGNLTQHQLKELTGFSIGSISTYLTVMMGIGAVEKRLIPGTHKYTYSITGEIENMFSLGYDIFLKTVSNSEPFLKSMKEKLRKLIDNNKKGAKQVYVAIEDLLNVFNVYKEAAPILLRSRSNNIT